jgi:hypothetical protein
MFYGWKRKYRTRRFNRQISGILNTRPIQVTDAPWMIVSMVFPRDLTMYLLCIKAFHRRMGGGRVVAIIPADLPESQQSLLRRHVEGIELQMIDEIDTGVCQRGGTWERLVFCLDRARDIYVIQLDSDVLAFGRDVTEVVNSANANLPFAMADGAEIVSMRETAYRAQRDTQHNHIGLAAARVFDRYPACDELRYVHGSSGFTGFARGGKTRHEIEDFHQAMSDLMGPRWTEWGTEQCASNFAIANSPDAVLLPYPLYSSFYPGGPRTAAKCLHFIGSYRFDEDFFASRAREEIARAPNWGQPAERSGQANERFSATT